MEQIRQVIQQMIAVSEDELNNFLNQAITKTFKRQAIISQPGAIPNEIFFINKVRYYTRAFKPVKKIRNLNICYLCTLLGSITFVRWRSVTLLALKWAKKLKIKIINYASLYQRDQNKERNLILLRSYLPRICADIFSIDQNKHNPSL